MPRMFSSVVMTMKPTIQSPMGMPGNWALMYEPPMSQMTMGRKR